MARFVPALAGPDAPAFINLLWLSHLIHQYNLSQDTIWVTSCTAHRSSPVKCILTSGATIVVAVPIATAIAGRH